jgi:hypothetical protein
MRLTHYLRIEHGKDHLKVVKKVFQKWHTNRKLRISVHLFIISAFVFYFFIVNEDHVLKIEKFNPTMTKPGRGFNMQPQGTSVIWIETEGLSNDSTVVVWGETKLDTIVHLERQVVTACVPEELFSTPGDFEIYLIDFENNIRSNKIIFKVLKY